MKIARNFSFLVFALLAVLLPVATVDAQLSNVAWKAAEELKKYHGNEVKYDDEGFVTEVVIQDLPSQFIVGQLAVFPKLESLTIDANYYFDNATMGGVRKLKSLKKFSLRNSRYATSASLEMLAEAPALESLDLYENSDITSLHDIPRIRRLKHLSIVPEEAMSFTPLLECRLLESIKLSGSTSIDDSSIKEIAQIKTLQKVDLSSTGITDEGLAELGTLPKLRELNLQSCKKITGEAFSEFQYPEMLTDVNLAYAELLNDAGLKAMGRFTQLEHLRLFRNSKIKGPGFECLASMKKLTNLRCAETSITDKHLALLDGIETLEKIWLHTCKGVSGRGLDRLSKSQGCTTINLENCRKIDSPDFEVIAKFKNVENLYLAKTRIRNENIELLCQLKKLQILSIAGNDWLDDAALEGLEACSVEKLIATDLLRLTDAAFQSASKMPNLVNLCVTAHGKLDGSGVKAFEGNTQIKYLTFESPGFLSLEACESIGKLPAIEELYFNNGQVSVSQLEQLAGMKNLRLFKYKVEDSASSNERLISILKSFPKLK